ncbi:glycoside hydrolase family 2 protein [Glonium stellatum]|uniref:Beta-mannosidase B n=1 Tax=Glonium stellatum TaxID=574774 RepID=A0A8E2JMC8_9PEZI|nr:glycoside hydrolase family 2 protein [Glonium stellatum]
MANFFSIHLDLMSERLIPDPFVGMNEKTVQWVHLKDWVYECAFPIPEVKLEEWVDLVFEGLDTFALATLNDQVILKSNNMFVPYRVNVSKLLKPMNILRIVFESPYIKGEEILKDRGQRVCWNGHYSRIYLRKAQYHFGWDWGPSLVTCGPWKPIFLEKYTSRIKNFRVDSHVAEDLQSAIISVSVEAEPFSKDHKMNVVIIGPDGNPVPVQEDDLGQRLAKLIAPQLWYPHTHGEQPLYVIRITVTSSSGEVLDTSTKTIGLRRIQLIQTPLKEGSTFYFAVNNVPIFMGGSNWIPGDNFLPRMDADRYSRWIDLVVKGKQNMLRVWGGGIYEQDEFYDECDRRGVLVWQDFCFACGQYPADAEFLQNVTEEAVAALERLRSHPSLVILAGNNEDYQCLRQADDIVNHDMSMPESEWLTSTFPARHIYERLLPDIVREQAPGTIYWPGSPWGGEDNNTDRTIGDVHLWNVSSGMLVPYQRYPDLAGRFVSEFGMLSCPHVDTIKKTFFGDSKDFHPQSEAFEFHCKANSYEKRMFTCMGENFRMSFELARYVYLSQLLQSEAMGWAFRGWRRKFEGKECGGALVWQTNDSWPVTSWSIIDYFERPKPAYFVISRALAPLAVGVVRKPLAGAAGIVAHSTPHIYPPRKSNFSVWVANATEKEYFCTVELKFISIESGVETRTAQHEKIGAKATGTTEVIMGECPEDEPTVLSARLINESGEVVAREADWPQPLKYITFPDRELEVAVRGEEVVVRARRPVKGLVFLNGIGWSDNCLDVIPGDEQRVSAKGLTENIEYIYYGKDEN